MGGLEEGKAVGRGVGTEAGGGKVKEVGGRSEGEKGRGGGRVQRRRKEDMAVGGDEKQEVREEEMREGRSEGKRRYGVRKRGRQEGVRRGGGGRGGKK